jgi:hypothetical protein
MANLVNIADGTIKKPLKGNKLFKTDYNTDDIIDLIKNAHVWGLSYTKELAEQLPGSTLQEFCSNIYSLLKDNVRYKVDPIGSQFVKSPGRVWSDKECDCKSYSIFIGTTLQNKGIKFKYRFVSFVEGSKRVTHVYIIVPTEAGKYITLDCVYDGYNSEKKPFYYKIDIMPGLHYLSGIGEGKKLLDLGNKDIADISDGEMDLLIARDRLATEKAIVERMQGIGSLKAEKYQDSIDMIDDAISAVHAYEMGAIGDIDTELALMCGQSHRGEYSSANQVSGIGSISGRKAFRNAKRKNLQVARKVMKKRLTPFQKANVWGIGEISGHAIGKGFFKKVAQKAKAAVKKVANSKLATVATGGANKLLTKSTRQAAIKKVANSKLATVATGGANKLLTAKTRQNLGKDIKKVGQDVMKVASFPLRLAAKGILEIQLPKAAPFFLYLFVNDQKIIDKMPEKARAKRKKSEKVADFIVNGIGMKRDHFMGIVRNGIMKHYGKSPENVLADQLKGIAGIGVVGAAITAVITIISKIISLVKGAKKSKDLDVSEADAPDASDFGEGATTATGEAVNSAELAADIKNQSSDSYSPDGSGSMESGGKKVWSSFG